MQKPVHTLDEYKNISADVWLIFKKYFPNGADLTGFADDVHALDEKHKKDVRQYCFMKALLKTYFNELNELKGVQDGQVGKGDTKQM